MIYFTCSLPAAEVALRVAVLVNQWFARDWAKRKLEPYVEPEPPTPFLDGDGRWWELDNTNNRKIDLKGPDQYAYRDRYPNPDRMNWLRAEIGKWATITESVVVQAGGVVA